MDTPNSKKTLIALFVILVVVISFLAYFLVTKNKLSLKKQPIDNTQKEIPKPVFDWVAQSNALPKTVEAKAAFAAGEYEKAYLLFKEAASSTDDFNVKSTLEISAAGTFMNIDTKKGSEYFVEIVNNPMYTNLSRGFALLQIAQFYKGTRDTRIIQAYAKSKDFINKPIEEIEYSLYQDIYALYPYGIAAASLARYELKKTPTKDIAQKVYTMYASGIDTNIEGMKKYEGMRIIVPNTYMSKAELYRDLYSYQVVTKEDVVKSYEDAHREIKVQNNKISEQFNLLSYTEFLLSVGEKAKAEELIAAIDGGGVTDMVKKNLSNVKGSKTDYKNIATFFSSKERSQKFANFFIQFGW